MVYLHGSNAPTSKCLDRHGRNATPFIYVTDCSYSALELVNISKDDWTICFIGSGNTNMTDYCAPIWAGGCLVPSWNDQADNYQTGCSDVFFYADINESGTVQYARPHEGWSFNGGTSPSGQHTLFDNSLSSITLLNNCTTG